MNVRNTTPKERMLKNIRQALLHKRDNPMPDFENSPLYKEETESVDILFAEQLTKAGGDFVYCDGEIALIENLIITIEEMKVSKVAVWETGLRSFLKKYGFPVGIKSDDLSEIEVGITSCESLIARNGSILLSSASESGRKLSNVPSAHFVIAKASQLVMDIGQALDKLKTVYGNRLPSMLTLVTGPATTNSVDNTLSKGGVGTEKLVVFLLEDRF